MGRIVLYTTSGCLASAFARHLLQKEGIEFTEIDLQKSPLAVDELDAVTGGDKTVPKLVFNHVLVGVR